MPDRSSPHSTIFHEEQTYILYKGYWYSPSEHIKVWTKWRLLCRQIFECIILKEKFWNKFLKFFFIIQLTGLIHLMYLSSGNKPLPGPILAKISSPCLDGCKTFIIVQLKLWVHTFFCQKYWLLHPGVHTTSAHGLLCQKLTDFAFFQNTITKRMVKVINACVSTFCIIVICIRTSEHIFSFQTGYQ